MSDGLSKDKTAVARHVIEDDTDESVALKVVLISTKLNHLIFTSFPAAIQIHNLPGDPKV